MDPKVMEMRIKQWIPIFEYSDAGTIGTFARIGWHQPPVRAVPAIGIFRSR